MQISLVLLLSFTTTYGVNILYLATIPSPSHDIWNGAFASELAKKGHNITYLSPYKNKREIANYTHVVVDGLIEKFNQEVDLIIMSQFSPPLLLWLFVDLNIDFCRAYLQSQNLQTIINSTLNYDLIIFDVSVGSCLYSLIQKFNYPPSIGVVPFLLPSHVQYNFGNHLTPASVPSMLLPYSTHMSFFERVWNFLFSHIDISLRHLKQYKAEYQEAKKMFGENLPPLNELERNVSLILTNVDPILTYPQSLPPNIIPVGGLHIQKPKKLPQDLATIIDGAKSGVIIFSLGTNIQSSQLDQHTRRAFLKAFSQISETVIWKFEQEISDLPKNVIVKKWLPQSDLLAHPNVKVFIGHGGALSTQEAIFHGKPMICVPFHLDQHSNARDIFERKLGMILDYKKVTEEYILEKLREILDNPIYAENMRKVSKRFRTQKETPMERALFWVEYVLLHGGTNFLSTSARDLPFYQKTGTDVFAFLILVTILISIGFFQIINIWTNRIKKVKTN